MTEPIVTATKGYAMLTQDQWIAEVQRLEALVAERTAERDSARALCVASEYFQSAEDDESEFVHVLEFCDHGENTTISNFDGPLHTFCNDCGAQLPNPAPDRPSAYDMPVGSVVETVEHTYTRMFTDAGSHGWARGKDKPATIQSGWIEGLFSDGLVTEWRLP